MKKVTRKQQVEEEYKARIPVDSPLELFLERGEQLDLEQSEHVPLRRAIENSTQHLPMFNEAKTANILKSKITRWEKEFIQESKRKEQAKKTGELAARRKNFGRGIDENGENYIGENIYIRRKFDRIMKV